MDLENQQQQQQPSSPRRRSLRNVVRSFLPSLCTNAGRIMLYITFLMLLFMLIFLRSPSFVIMGLSCVLLGLGLSIVHLQIQRDSMLNRDIQQGFAASAGGGRYMNHSFDPLSLQLSLMNRDFTAEDYEMLLTLDNSVPSNNGAEQSEIDRLPSYIFQQTTDHSKAHNCAICLEALIPGSSIRILPCMHQFHSNCVDRWLKMQATCPVCKLQVI